MISFCACLQYLFKNQKIQKASLVFCQTCGIEHHSHIDFTEWSSTFDDILTAKDRHTAICTPVQKGAPNADVNKASKNSNANDNGSTSSNTESRDEKHTNNIEMNKGDHRSAQQIPNNQGSPVNAGKSDTLNEYNSKTKATGLGCELARVYNDEATKKRNNRDNINNDHVDKTSSNFISGKAHKVVDEDLDQSGNKKKKKKKKKGKKGKKKRKDELSKTTWDLDLK